MSVLRPESRAGVELGQLLLGEVGPAVVADQQQVHRLAGARCPSLPDGGDGVGPVHARVGDPTQVPAPAAGAQQRQREQCGDDPTAAGGRRCRCGRPNSSVRSRRSRGRDAAACRRAGPAAEGARGTRPVAHARHGSRVVLTSGGCRRRWGSGVARRGSWSGFTVRRRNGPSRSSTRRRPRVSSLTTHGSHLTRATPPGAGESGQAVASARSAIISPIGIADVAAGDGALSTCRLRAVSLEQEVVHQRAVAQHRLGPDAGLVGQQVVDSCRLGAVLAGTRRGSRA